MRNNTIDEAFFDEPAPAKKEFFWQHFEDQQVFCGFDVVAGNKHPMGMDRLKGISSDASIDRLGTYQQAKDLGYPYIGISLVNPVRLGDKFLVCLDLDWKRAPDGCAEVEQIDLMLKLNELGCYYEESYSKLGAHYWVLCDADKIPKTWKLGNKCEIEVFSGFSGKRANVMITDEDVDGDLIEVDLMAMFPAPEVMEKKAKQEYVGDKQEDFDLAKKLLLIIPPDDYREEWIPIGMILKSEFGEAGFDIWNRWSSSGASYKPEIMRYKWGTFNGEGLTMATLVAKAKENGYRPEHKKSTPWEDFGELDMDTGEVKFAEAAPEKKINPWLERIRPISQQLTPPNWLIDGILADKMTMIAGSAGVGKTSCLVPLALVAAGFQSHLSNIGAKYHRKVIYVTEDKWQIDSIIHGIIKHMVLLDGSKVSYEMIAERFIVVETMKSKIPDLIKLAEVADIYKEDYQATNGIISMMPLIIFDTSSASFSLDDENDNSEASKYVAAIKENFISKDIPIWIVAHTAKAHKRAELSALSVRGAGAFEGDANCVAYLISEEGVNCRYLVLGKHRYAAKYKEIAIDSVVHQEMALNAYGDPEDVFYRYSTLERSSEGERVQAAEIAKAEKVAQNDAFFEDRIKSIVSQNPKLTKTDLIKQVGGNADTARILVNKMLDQGKLACVDSGEKSGNNREILFMSLGF